MADENRKADRIELIKKYKEPGTSAVKINQADVPNSSLFLPNVDDPSTYDKWGELFNTFTFPQLTESLKELKYFIDEWKVLGDAVIKKVNQNEYGYLNNNLKNVGVKVGYSNLTTIDDTKVFVHGFNKEGRPADIDGSFFLGTDSAETSNVDNPLATEGTVGSIVGARNVITKTTLGPLSSNFVNQITVLVIEKSGSNYIPKLISIPRDQVNEKSANYTTNVWSKDADDLATSSVTATGLKFPSVPTDYGKFYDAQTGATWNPYKSEVDSLTTREVATWNDVTRVIDAPAQTSSFSIKTRLVKDAYVLGVFETYSNGGFVNFSNFTSFPTPVSLLTFLLSFELDKNFIDFRVNDFKDKEALFKKVHDEIQARVYDTNKIKGEIDRNIRPYTLKKQMNGGQQELVLEYFNNTADSVVQSLFKNDVKDNAVVYPAGLATRRRFLSSVLMNDDLDEVWIHGRASEKLLKLGTVNQTGSSNSEIKSGFKINGDFLTTGSTTIQGNTSLSGTLGVTGAVNLSSTLGVTDLVTLANNLMLNGGTLGSTNATINLFNANATINAFQTSTLVNLLSSTTVGLILNLANGSTASGSIKEINIGTGALTGATTQITLGSIYGTSSILLNRNVTVADTLTVTGATTLNSTLLLTGGATLNSNLNVNGLVTFADDLVINGENLTTTASTFNLLNTNLSTLNLGATALTLTIGGKTTTTTTNLQTGALASGSTKTIMIGTGGLSGSTTAIVLGTTTGTSTITLQGNEVLTGTLTVTGATTLKSTLGVVGLVTLTNDLAVNGGDLTTTATIFNLLTSSATTINFANSAVTFNLASSVTGAQTVTFAGGVTASGSTKTIRIGSNGASGSTTNILLGATAGTSNLTFNGTSNFIGTHNITGAFNLTGDAVLSGDFAINGGDLTSTATTFNLLTQPTTISAFNSATLLILGSSTNTSSIGIGNGTTSSGNTKTIYIGNAGLAGSTTNIILGTESGGTTTIKLVGSTTNYGTLSVTGATTLSSTLTTTSDITSATEIKAYKLKEVDTDTEIQKYLGDIYQHKFSGSAGINAINLPKNTLLYITKGATAYGAIGTFEPDNYSKGTWDSVNKIFSNTNYNFGINFSHDGLVLQNDSFIEYPTASTGFKSDFSVYFNFDDTGVTQTAASTYYELVKYANASESLEIGFQTNSVNDNFTLVVKRNGTTLTDTLTVWEATQTAKTADEVFRDKTIKNRSISFNLYNGFLNVVVGSEIVAKYAFADFTNVLNILTLGKHTTNSLKGTLNSFVLAPFTTSQFAYHNGTAWVPDKNYNQELQSNEGKFYYNRQPDFVEILAGKVYISVFASNNIYTGTNTYIGDGIFSKAIKVTENGKTGWFGNAETSGLGTYISSCSTHAIYVGESSSTAPKYTSDSGTNVYDILTTRHAFSTPEGKVVLLTANDSLDGVDKTGFYNINNFTGAPTGSKWWFVNNYVYSGGSTYARQEARSFDGLEDYFRIRNGGSFGSWIKNWNANNDGSGSGLDADLLEGYHGSSGATINNYALRGETIANIQVSGLSAFWGTTSGVNTGGINVVCGASSAATWLISGTNAGTFKGGIQLLDIGDGMRIYSSTSRFLELLNTELNWANNMTVGGEIEANISVKAPELKTGNATIKYNEATKSLDFVFA